MANYRRVISSDPDKHHTVEQIRQLRRQICVLLELLSQLEQSLGPGQGSKAEVLNEKSGYSKYDYMPDYILDDNGYIVDVIPGSVRIAPCEQRPPERERRSM